MNLHFNLDELWCIASLAQLELQHLNVNEYIYEREQVKKLQEFLTKTDSDHYELRELLP